MTVSSNSNRPFLIDGLQYAQWSETIFSQMREVGLDAVHATILYHGSFRNAVDSIGDWNRRFRIFSHLIMPAYNHADLVKARDTNRTAILLGLQNPSAIEDDVGLIEILHQLGVRFMQLTYNNQSLLGTGYLESVDAGLTRMGREALREMNRLGMIVDLSHAGEKTAADAIEQSSRPVAITHANPRIWHNVPRNITSHVLKLLSERGGMLGLSLYPLHLKFGSNCRLEEFCQMVAETAERFGIEMLGIGSDLCQGRPPSSLQWMRTGKWTIDRGSADERFPAQPEWFTDSLGFAILEEGLKRVGFNEAETSSIVGENWRRFFAQGLDPMKSETKPT